MSNYLLILLVVAVGVFVYMSYTRNRTKTPGLDHSVQKAVRRHQEKEQKASTVNKEVKEFNQPQTPVVSTTDNEVKEPVPTTPVVPFIAVQEKDKQPEPVITASITTVEQPNTLGESDEPVVVEDTNLGVEKYIPEEKESEENPSFTPDNSKLGSHAHQVEEEEIDVKEVVSTLRFDLEVTDLLEDVSYPKGAVVKVMSRRWNRPTGEVVESYTAFEILEISRSRARHKPENDMKPLLSLMGTTDYNVLVTSAAVKAVVEHLESKGIRVDTIHQLKVPNYLVNTF